MSHAVYNKDILLEWCEIAPKILDDKIEKLFQEYLDRKLACALERYKFWKRFLPWLSEPKKEDFENFERKSCMGLHEDALISFYGCRESLQRIYRFCITSDRGYIFLDGEDVYYGLSRLGYGKWRQEITLKGKYES